MRTSIQIVVICGVLAVFASFTVSFGQQTPLTPLSNLRVVTDDNGYLLVTSNEASGQGPLTPLGNVRGRTDSNGYLLIGLAQANSTLVISDTFYIDFAQNSDPAAGDCDAADEHGRITVNDGTAGTAGVYVCDQNGATTGWILIHDLST